MFISLRSQYFLGGIITLVLMLALLLWNALRLVDGALEERFQSELDLAAPLLGAAAAPLLATHDHAGLQALLDSSASARRLSFAEVSDASGVPVARVGQTTAEGAQQRSQRHSIVRAGQRLGELQLGIDASALATTRQRLLRNSLLIGAAVLALGLGLLALWTTWVGQSLRRLAQASQRVADGDYAHQLGVSRVEELAQVADAFNRMSAAIRTKLSALLESEQHQRSLVASMSGGLLVCDAEGRMLDWNEAALRLLDLVGLDPHDRSALQQRLQRSCGLGAEDLPWARALRTGLPQREVLLHCRRGDGSERWLSCNAEPRFAAAAAQPSGVVCTLSDVSRHVQGEQALRALNEGLEARVLQRTQELQAARDAAERASQAKSQFLSRMSHELRTPLNAILGFAQLLAMSRERLRQSEADKITQIERAGWHLLELINDVLDLARIEAGEMETRPEAVQVQELIREALQMLSSLATQHAVSVRLLPGETLWVRADRKRLKQVLNNLLSNALKYNRRGGHVQLEVSSRPGEQVAISVKDSGRGMSPEQLAELYKPFVRLDQSDDLTPGTGIGLVITRRLVELMGGSIAVSSQPGVGSEFTVTLQRCAAPEAVELAPQTLRATAAALLGRRRLLYIEDNPANAEMLAGLLKRHGGYELSLAVDGRTGLELLRSRQPELLLIDIDLPGIDGIEVCRRVRSDPRCAGLPLVALSAKAMPEDIQQALDAGFDRYLTKPLDFRLLLKTLDALLAPQ